MTTTPARLPVRVIGIGNEFRGDDAVGLRVARLLDAADPAGVEVLEESGEGAALMEAWNGAPAVILIDASQSGARPGEVIRLDATLRPMPSGYFRYSTHAFSVAEAIELARALGRMPPRLVVYAIEGKQFKPGAALSPEVESAAREAARRIVDELKSGEAGSCTNSRS